MSDEQVRRILQESSDEIYNICRSLKYNDVELSDENIEVIEDSISSIFNAMSQLRRLKTNSRLGE